jgi:hypothetical protein
VEPLTGAGAATFSSGHEAGLILLDEELATAKLRDLDDVARLFARLQGCSTQYKGA